VSSGATWARESPSAAALPVIASAFGAQLYELRFMGTSRHAFSRGATGPNLAALLLVGPACNATKTLGTSSRLF